MIKKEKKRIIIIVLCIILAVVLLLGLVAFLFIKSKLDLVQYDSGTNVQTDDIEPDDIEIDTEGLDESDPQLSDAPISSDQTVINILLLGTDERTADFSSFARSDSMMLLSLNLKTHKAKLVSLERGMGVPILEGTYAGQYDWLTHCFQYGGADLVMKEIRECFRVDVTKYIRTSFNTFIRIVDILGGVDITLTEAETAYMNAALPEGETAVSVGENHLNGTKALIYARCRKIDSDWQRIKRQRNIIQACLDGISNAGITDLNSLADQILPLVQTNFSQWEVFSLCLQIPNFLGTQLDQMTIPAAGTYGSMTGMGNRSMFSVDFEKNAQILQEFFYSEE